ncbi:MAG: hypothetical protein ACREQ9_17710, partial [Candidatus Binatia bacterium]
MKTHPTRFGVQTAQQNVEWRVLLDFWRKVDDLGYDTLWNFDHFYPIFTNPEGQIEAAREAPRATGEHDRPGLLLGSVERAVERLDHRA